MQRNRGFEWRNKAKIAYNRGNSLKTEKLVDELKKINQKFRFLEMSYCIEDLEEIRLRDE